jgi:hypothetical protein
MMKKKGSETASGSQTTENGTEVHVRKTMKKKAVEVAAPVAVEAEPKKANIEGLSKSAPWRIETKSGKYFVLQCVSKKHARDRITEEQPDEEILLVEEVK